MTNPSLSFILSELWHRKSVLRAYLNAALKDEVLAGKTIDIGGGKNADYISFMSKADDCEFVTFDIKSGATVDFETDLLPAADGEYDTVLFLNVMEHIYNHQHICREVVRITKSGGKMIGFVPFLMWYHADHKDFFRYTHEALEQILDSSAAKNHTITMVGAGPFIAAAHMVLQSFPRLLRIPIFLWYYSLDTLYRKLKRSQARPYALGYLFTVHK
jgi:SAM-dependent methyltransferase